MIYTISQLHGEKGNNGVLKKKTPKTVFGKNFKMVSQIVNYFFRVGWIFLQKVHKRWM